MNLTTVRRLSALLLCGLGAVSSLPACMPASPDEPLREDAVTDEEGLNGSLPIGTALRTTGNVNLRSGPSTSNGVLSVIPSGSQVTLQEAAPNNGFYRISHNGTVGWTSGKYLEPAGGGTSGPATLTLTTTADVNLRSGPSTTNAILAVIPLGTEVSTLSPDPVSGFYNVRYDGIDGWTSGKYLSPGGSSSTYAGGKLWTFKASKLPVDIAVFVPSAADPATEVSVVFYAHGLNVCSPVAKNPPTSFVTDAPFALGKLVDASKKPVVLAVPFFDWEHLSANGMATGGTNHKLGIPENLNAVVAEVLEQVGKHRSTGAPTLASLILAGHSRAYSFLNPLAAAHADPQMSSGALAHLSEVWAFDTGYTCSTQAWSSWLAKKPSLDVTMFYRAGTGTAACGKQFEGLVPGSGGRLSVHVAKEAHCAVPATEMPSLLGDLP